MTVVLKPVEDISGYGVARLESDKVVDFVEKPRS